MSRSQRALLQEEDQIDAARLAERFPGFKWEKEDHFNVRLPLLMFLKNHDRGCDPQEGGVQFVIARVQEWLNSNPCFGSILKFDATPQQMSYCLQSLTKVRVNPWYRDHYKR